MTDLRALSPPQWCRSRSRSPVTCEAAILKYPQDLIVPCRYISASGKCFSDDGSAETCSKMPPSPPVPPPPPLPPLLPPPTALVAEVSAKRACLLGCATSDVSAVSPLGVLPVLTSSNRAVYPEWHEYVQGIYGVGTPRFPIDLNNFNWFYWCTPPSAFGLAN